MTDLDLISDKPEPLTKWECFFIGIATAFVFVAILLWAMT
jgi:hypothetical protein